jgi:hypothetical protein
MINQEIAWKHQETIKVLLQIDGELVESTATATIAGDTGLAYRRHDGFPTYKDARNRWGITHIASGMEFQMYFFSELAVQRAIEAIAPLTDWHQDAEYLRQAPNLKDRMVEAAKGTGFEVDLKGERA